MIITLRVRDNLFQLLTTFSAGLCSDQRYQARTIAVHNSKRLLTKQEARKLVGIYQRHLSVLQAVEQHYEGDGAQQGTAEQAVMRKLGMSAQQVGVRPSWYVSMCAMEHAYLNIHLTCTSSCWHT